MFSIKTALNAWQVLISTWGVANLCQAAKVTYRALLGSSIKTKLEVHLSCPLQAGMSVAGESKQEYWLHRDQIMGPLVSPPLLDGICIGVLQLRAI